MNDRHTKAGGTNTAAAIMLADEIERLIGSYSPPDRCMILGIVYGMLIYRAFDGKVGDMRGISDAVTDSLNLGMATAANPKAAAHIFNQFKPDMQS